MSEEEDARFPLLEDDDSFWLSWIEKQHGKLEIEFNEDVGPQEAREQAKWLKRLARLLTVRSKRQRIWQLELNLHHINNVRREDCTELIIALLALFTPLYKHLACFTFRSATPVLCLCFQFVPELPKLSLLYLSERVYTGYGEYIVDLLRKCPNLKYLDLSGCELVDSDVSAIGSVSCSSLEVFRISGNKLTSRGMDSVAAMLRGCRQIQVVNLGEIEPGDVFGGTSEVFTSLVDKPRLELLECGGSVLAADELRCLHQMGNLKHLSVNFAGNDSEFRSLCASLRGTGSLTRLDLKCENTFSLECDRIFADVLRSLDQLANLRFTCVDSAVSFKHLGEYIGSSGCRLRELYVTGVGHDLLASPNTSLTDLANEDGVARALSQALPHNKTLRSLFWDDDLLPENWTMIVEGARYSAIESLTMCLASEFDERMYRLVEDVANQGYLVHACCVSESCRKRMEFNKRLHDAARDAALTMLAVRRFRKSALNAVLKDIVKLIAYALYATRANDVWSNAFGDEEKERKRRKMRDSEWDWE